MKPTASISSQFSQAKLFKPVPVRQVPVEPAKEDALASMTSAVYQAMHSLLYRAETCSLSNNSEESLQNLDKVQFLLDLLKNQEQVKVHRENERNQFIKLNALLTECMQQKCEAVAPQLCTEARDDDVSVSSTEMQSTAPVRKISSEDAQSQRQTETDVNPISSEKEDVSPKSAQVGDKSRKQILHCPHTDKKHYAKNMCHNCYHRKGKSKKADKCGHPERAHYSAGMCQNCYLAKYYLKRKQKQERKRATDDVDRQDEEEPHVPVKRARLNN